MKSPIRFLLLCCLVLGWGISLSAQPALRINQIIIQPVGPPSTSDAFVRANIRSKVGETYSRTTVDEDIKNLIGTGYFRNVQVVEEPTSDGIKLIYSVQGKPIITAINITGNKAYKNRKILKKITAKVGQPLDERKLFADAQEVQKMYQKAGYQKTTVKAVTSSVDEATGRGTVTFEIHESPKIKIKDIVFENANAFPQKRLRKVLKTKRHWFLSFLTGSGVLKEDEFEDDKDRLVEFYQNEGYIDFAIKDVKFDYVTPSRMVVRFVVSEGKQYKVGSVEFKGNKLFSTNDFLNGVVIQGVRTNIVMTTGKTFTPVGLAKDTETIQDIYGSKGYIDTRVTAIRTPNPTTGTMDLTYQIEESDRSNIEKIEIRGNTKTRDRVIRRELSVVPGEVYDTVKVKTSKLRIEGLNYFEKVDTRPEATDVPNGKNLVIDVEEKNTGNITMGAGFSSVDQLVGYVDVTQGNFDLFAPPTFTGGGQKARLHASLGTVMQNYELSFIEPWFLGRKLAFEFDLFHRDLNYLSLNDLYSERETGGTIGLTRALGSDFLIGKVAYTLENIGIDIGSDRHTNFIPRQFLSAGYYSIPISEPQPPNISQEIFLEGGDRLVSKIAPSIAYDTRNHSQMPNRGQRTELATELAGGPLGGDTDFYKLTASSAWYFKGFANDHIFEIGARAGVVEAYNGQNRVPIFDRWFLGGLTSLRGYRFREIGPKDEFNEPIGGNTFFFGSAEYSVPVVDRVRFAVFYDIGNVYRKAYSFESDPGRVPYSDNWGVGLRVNLPMLGPLRFDYGVPITHNDDTSSSGRFQFSVGFNRPF